MKLLRALAVGVGIAALGGCSTTSVILNAAGVVTDSSVTWAVLKHVHDKLTFGDPTACHRLDSVERALNPRCGSYVPGSIRAADVAASRLPECALTIAARDPQTWRALPDLIAAGAQPEACATPPLVALAQSVPSPLDCVDFGPADAGTVQAIRWLADADVRSIHHDVARAFSCPEGRSAGLDRVLDGWLARGDLSADRLSFGALGALHPSHLFSPLAQGLQAQGHSAQAALGSHPGRLAGGYELALRQGDAAALRWWLEQQPALANRVPPARGGELAWVPLARVLRDGFMLDAAQQRPTVELLLAHGADPSQRLPYQSDLTVLGQATRANHPLRGLLEAPVVPMKAPPAGGPPATVVAAGDVR